jgi:hypothetical protein
MRRDEIVAELRALAGPAARERLRRALTGPATRERVHLTYAALRRHPDILIVTGVVLGVVVMLLHWS